MEDRLLAFEVTEQQLHFERDIALLDGSFEVVPVAEIDPVDTQAAPGCEIVLTTRYRRKLYPEAVWSPIERTVVHALHEHVLEGMRRSIEAKNRPQLAVRHEVR